MTKAELITDFTSRSFVDSLIGSAIMTKDEALINVKWYDQNYWEVQGKAAVKKTIHFYVEDEGGGGERAFYKNSEPSSTTTRNSFDNWLNIQLYILVATGVIASWVVLKASEDVNHALVAIAELAGTTGKLDYKAYLCIQSPTTGNLERTQFNISPSDLMLAVARKL